jgi:hypothetical protein
MYPGLGEREQLEVVERLKACCRSIEGYAS